MEGLNIIQKTAEERITELKDNAKKLVRMRSIVS